MDDRGYGSGFSNWGGGSGNRGSGQYDSYGDDSGYDGFGQMKRGLSGGSMMSSGAHADAVIAKINQRLDMLSQMEGNMKRDRYDQYESYDSQSSAYTSRDLYRSGGGNYGYDGRGDMMLGQRGGLGGGGYDSPSSSYGLAKMRQNMRESFIGGSSGDGGGGWPGAGRRSPRRGGGGRGGYGDRRSDPTPVGGGGRGKLPSLLSDRLYPMSGGFHRGSNQGPHDFPGRHFGGGPRAGRQRGRKRPLNKQQNNPQKKRKESPDSTEEPESKMIKEEGEEAQEKDADEETKKNGDEADDDQKTETDEAKPAADGEDGEEKAEDAQGKKKQGKQKQQEKAQKAKKKRGFLDRMTYACSLCKFRSFYKDEMEAHLQSRFHKEHFRYLASQLSKPTTDFLEEYLLNKYKKTEERITQLENFNTIISNFYKEQDLTRELGMEHFLKKVEAAHCVACDIFIPMQPHLIEKHMKSHEHNYHRKEMMEFSKKASLAVARSILNHKFIGMKLEKYLKGENPFTDRDENDPEETILTEAAEGGEAAEGAECQAEAMADDKEPVVEEEAAEETEKTEEQETDKVEEEEEEQQQQQPELQAQEENGQELEGNPEEDEGFEMGDDDGGFFVRDEIGDENFQFEQ
ncbi:A-kinase anchor protein 8-like isoform 1-T1 [Synchiropus picturatus]